ncbi:unnamed protein product [Allacma fusca]|uniref:Uncharacterized protein n=1 Tax=Allacma fusca TaxID=39272 RepID=A0A8J2LVE8_9HEXA|nr:unnamed protein product [Allacma fusca]
MPLPRRLGYSNYSPVIDCEYKPCFNDSVCCSAPKPFKDKYCEEQKIWRQVNCCRPKKSWRSICCPKWDKTEELCSRFRNTTNWNCVKDRNFRENNKTMLALTTHIPRTCLPRRDCPGLNYSMQGPVNHPPGYICQDYSLYIPTDRVLQHCQCKGNHRCKKVKRLPGRCYPCTRSCIPIGDECCDQCNPCQNPMPCNPCNAQVPCNNTGIAADIHNYCCQKAGCQPNQQCSDDSANFPGYDPCNEQNQDNNNVIGDASSPCPDYICNCGAVPCNGCCGMNEMQKLLEEFKHKWNYSDPRSGRRINRNPILGINTEPQGQIQLSQKENNNDCSAAGNEMGNTVCTQQADCDCATCRGREIRLNGNHYDNCTCGICQRRRGCCGFVSPKITDRKADRCKKLWFDNQREPCHVNPDNSDRTVLNVTNMNHEVLSSMECTNCVDCPCPTCCRKRQYARIKPYNCYANGLTNPAIELKKMYFVTDENNNASGDKAKGKRSKANSSNPGSDRTSGATSQSNSVTNYGSVTPTSDRSNNNIPRKTASQQQLQQNKINVDENQINYDDQDAANVEYFTGDCQRENPCRKSFGLDVTYRQQCNNDCCNDGCNDCCNDGCNNCSNGGCCPNDCCNNCCYPSCPCDPCQNQQCPCGPCPNQPCPCDPCETSMSNYPHLYPPTCRLRRRMHRCIPAATAMDDCCQDGGGCNGECDPNDYNTTVYRESFKRMRPTDDGCCNGRPRYRRGRMFDTGCQNYLLRSNTFGIFDNMFKPMGTPACKQCDEECMTRICHDKQCRMPFSMELRKIRWPVEDDGAPTCCCQCGMLDRYCNTCDQTV